MPCPRYHDLLLEILVVLFQFSNFEPLLSTLMLELFLMLCNYMYKHAMIPRQNMLPSNGFTKCTQAIAWSNGNSMCSHIAMACLVAQQCHT